MIKGEIVPVLQRVQLRLWRWRWRWMMRRGEQASKVETANRQLAPKINPHESESERV